MQSQPELIFGVEFDERTVWKVGQKGFFEHARVRLPDGRTANLCFWDPIRLAQDLENDRQQGRICIGEPGLVVIPKVTVENMRSAVNELYRRGYFERLAAAIA